MRVSLGTERDLELGKYSLIWSSCSTLPESMSGRSTMDVETTPGANWVARYGDMLDEELRWGLTPAVIELQRGCVATVVVVTEEEVNCSGHVFCR